MNTNKKHFLYSFTFYHSQPSGDDISSVGNPIKRFNLLVIFKNEKTQTLTIKTAKWTHVKGGFVAGLTVIKNILLRRHLS